MADQLLGLDHVRRDDVRLGAHGVAQRVAVGVDDRHHVELVQLAHQSARRSRARRPRGSEPANDDDRGAARQVEQLLAELLELVGLDARPLLVDLGLLAGRRVEHRGVRARLLADPDEVVEDRLARRAARRSACRSGRPGSPVAMTGWPSVFSIRAMLTPLPPASARRSTVRWRRPSRKLGTDSDLSIAALSVTVMIIASVLWRCDARRACACTSRLHPRAGSRQSATPAACTTRARQPRCDRRHGRRRRGTAAAVTSGTDSIGAAVLGHRDRALRRCPPAAGRAAAPGTPERDVQRDACEPRRAAACARRRAAPAARAPSTGDRSRRSARRSAMPRVAVGAQAVAQQRERVGVARRLARGAEHDADQAHAVQPRGADEALAGVGGVARLDADDPRVGADKVVAVVDDDAVGEASRCGSSTICAKQRLAHAARRASVARSVRGRVVAGGVSSPTGVV